MTRCVSVLVLLLTLLTSVVGRAQSAPKASTSPSSEAHATSVLARPATVPWGLIVIATSLAVGATLTQYGLLVDCRDGDHACRRRAGMPIWGGIGLATAGSLVGLGMLRSSDSSSAALVSVGGSF